MAMSALKKLDLMSWAQSNLAQLYLLGRNRMPFFLFIYYVYIKNER